MRKLPPKGVDEEGVSYDVEALFTNVPIDVTIDYIIDEIYEKEVLKPLCKKLIFKRLLKRHIFGQRETHTSNRWLSYRRQIFYDNGKYLYDKMHKGNSEALKPTLFSYKKADTDVIGEAFKRFSRYFVF